MSTMKTELNEKKNSQDGYIGNWSMLGLGRISLVKQDNATRSDFSIDGSKPTENDVILVVHE